MRKDFEAYDLISADLLVALIWIWGIAVMALSAYFRSRLTGIRPN